MSKVIGIKVLYHYVIIVISVFKDLQLSSQGQGCTIHLKSPRSTYQPPLKLDFVFKLVYFH